MQAFAALLDALSYQPARNAKLRLIEAYLKETPDPDRGWALAALTSGLDFPAAKPALLRGFGEDKIGQELFHLSYDYVGDLAETLSLIWETDANAGPPPTLGEVVDTLQAATKMQTPAILKRWLDSLDAAQIARTREALAEYFRPNQREDGLYVEAVAILVTADR